MIDNIKFIPGINKVLLREIDTSQNDDNNSQDNKLDFGETKQESPFKKFIVLATSSTLYEEGDMVMTLKSAGTNIDLYGTVCTIVDLQEIFIGER